MTSYFVEFCLKTLHFFLVAFLECFMYNIIEVSIMNIDLDLSMFMKDLDKNCSKVQKKSFKKGELITSYIAKRNQLCLMLSRRS